MAISDRYFFIVYTAEIVKNYDFLPTLFANICPGKAGQYYAYGTKLAYLQPDGYRTCAATC